MRIRTELDPQTNLPTSHHVYPFADSDRGSIDISEVTMRGTRDVMLNWWNVGPVSRDMAVQYTKAMIHACTLAKQLKKTLSAAQPQQPPADAVVKGPVSSPAPAGAADAAQAASVRGKKVPPAAALTPLPLSPARTPKVPPAPAQKTLRAKKTRHAAKGSRR